MDQQLGSRDAVLSDLQGTWLVGGSMHVADIDPRDDERERPDLSRGSARDRDDRSRAGVRVSRRADARSRPATRLERDASVRDRDRLIELRESEVRMLATVAPSAWCLRGSSRPTRTSRELPARRPERPREAGLVETRPYVIGRDRRRW